MIKIVQTKSDHMNCINVCLFTQLKQVKSRILAQANINITTYIRISATIFERMFINLNHTDFQQKDLRCLRKRDTQCVY